MKFFIKVVRRAGDAPALVLIVEMLYIVIKHTYFNIAHYNKLIGIYMVFLMWILNNVPYVQNNAQYIQFCRALSLSFIHTVCKMVEGKIISDTELYIYISEYDKIYYQASLSLYLWLELYFCLFWTN